MHFSTVIQIRWKVLLCCNSTHGSSDYYKYWHDKSTAFVSCTKITAITFILRNCYADKNSNYKISSMYHGVTNKTAMWWKKIYKMHMWFSRQQTLYTKDTCILPHPVTSSLITQAADIKWLVCCTTCCMGLRKHEKYSFSSHITWYNGEMYCMIMPLIWAFRLILATEY